MAILDTDKVLVANWFDKDTLEVFLDRKLSDEEYAKFVEKWNLEGWYDYISAIVSQWANAVDKELSKKKKRRF